MRDDVGVIVARFQVPALHAGHKELLKTVIDENSTVLVVLGVARGNPSQRNPLSFRIRARMIRTLYPGMLVMPMMDERSDKVWSEKLDALISSVVGERGGATLYSGEDGFASHYTGNYPVETISTVDCTSGSEMRASCIRTPPATSGEFRRGIIHGLQQQYPITWQVVDMITTHNGKIILGRKPNEGKWRLPGGFVNHTETLEQAATREFEEETGIHIDPTGWEFFDNMIVNDWRVRGLDDQWIRTTVFLNRGGGFGVLKAGDDLEEVREFTIRGDHGLEGLIPDQIVEEHVPILEKLLGTDFNGEKS